MRLISLRLKNFRQHADTTVDFRPGLTGIVGPNGAGKSTLLEALAWAIYGAQAARGTNDTIRFARAAPRSRVEVELAFALGGHEYRVVRTLAQAEVYVDGGEAPVATGLGGASQFLQTRLGMSREEFFNTYFTGQKELQFLAAMGPADRGRFLSQVLGYERLRRAQELARERRAELRSEIRGLRASLGDPEEIAAATAAARRRLEEGLAAVREAERALSGAAEERARVAPRWAGAQAARERFRELSHAVERAEQDGAAARREIERAAAELDAVAAAEAELAPLRERLRELPAATDRCARLSELARHDEQRRGMERRLEELAEERARLGERMERVAEAPELERRYAAELAGLREARAAAEAELEERKTAWLRDRQDAATKLQHYRDRGRELKAQLRQVEALGPEGTCPTCGRPVGDGFEALLEELRDGWQEIVQDGKWWASRVEQLEPRPAEVGSLEERLRALTEQVDDRASRHARCQSAVAERAQLAADAEALDARRGRLGEELAALPAGYDATEHRAAEAGLAELREVETRAARLEAGAARRGAQEAALADARRREAEAGARGAAAAEERGALDFSEEAYRSAREEHERADAAHRAAELRLADLRGALHAAEEGAEAAERTEAQHRERLREVEAHETELHYHEELDTAYSELRQELNDHVRPELSELASAFLAQLTDGRYTSMEIDEGYNLMVLDEGEEKPVISGGEEDVANLVLRLSLSQMIAERAGHPLSLLILDEIFGSLDVSRRDNVVQLLHHLEDRFEQVILITHVEGIREGLDQVLRVEFDERHGRSVVREETPPGEGGRPETMAAD